MVLRSSRPLERFVADREEQSSYQCESAADHEKHHAPIVRGGSDTRHGDIGPFSA
jgi:hypothetical protein